MKNKIKPKVIIQRNIRHSRKSPILSKNKSPIALFIATALFMVGGSPAMAEPEHTGKVDGSLTLRKEEQAEKAIIDRYARLTLTDNAKAEDTRVNLGGLFKQEGYSRAKGTTVERGSYTLSDYSNADSTEILGGEFIVSDHAVANNTRINSLLLDEQGVDDIIYSQMHLKKNGKITGTTVYPGNTLNIKGPNSHADTTIIQDRALLSVTHAGATLTKTYVHGKLELSSNVTLEGQTLFTPTSILESNGYLIQNNGEFLFIDSANHKDERNEEITITAIINGTGSLTQKGIKTLTLFGKRNPSTPDYAYSGDTNINDGTLKIFNSTFVGSPINGKKNTYLILDNSELTTTVQGSNIHVGDNSIWNMVGNSSVDNLSILEDGILTLNSPSKIGNTLVINGDYKSKNGTLVFQTQLAGDNSLTDRMIVKGNTFGNTKVQIKNTDGTGAITQIGIPLIEVKGESEGEFIQIGRHKMGAFEYKLGRGKDVLRKNWYMHSSKNDYIVDNNKPSGPDLLNFFINEGLKTIDDYSAAPETSEPTLVQGTTLPSETKPTDAEPNNKPSTENLFDKNLLDYIADKGVKLLVQGSIPQSTTNPAAHTSNANELIAPPDYPNENVNKAKPSSKDDDVMNNTKPTDAEPNNKPSTENPFDKNLLDSIADKGVKLLVQGSTPQSTTTPTTDTSDADSGEEKPVDLDKKNDANLVSIDPPATPEKAPEKAVAVTSHTTNKAATAAKTSSPSQPQVYAPENGSYIANIVMARSFFNTRFEDRSGSYQYKDAVSGQWRTSSMWMRTQGGKNNFGHAVDQLDINGKYYSVQLGMDVIQEGSGRVGVLAGLGKATSHSKSKVTDYYSNGSVNGYNLGVYATWLPEQKDNTGFYIDTLAQYSWFNNTVNGQEQAEDKYKSSGFTTSIESGYTFKMATTGQLGYFIQPNAQVTLQGIQTQSHKTADGELISDDNKGHMVTRIGAKTYLQTMNSQDSQFTPFIAVSWLHQNQNTGAIISGQRVESKSKNSTEFKIGLESKIEQQLHVWATIDYQMGRYSDNNANALAGIKYHF
ncbi:autotransporter outer membrane beta-barrel domain-containing protein [Yersinia aleksiciae]|uniref:autotransporter outer membrane beta-barrel domain-containing protein n=1 Tax=Yersinia aleksiciae TaxID=263819 RepID=UPI0021BDD45B|nr:autotransporter outer membrane beta-barrel domain-containing protein [Yersinia aleksiciae]